MAITEKLNKKIEGMNAKMAEKAEGDEGGKESEIDSGEWLLLFLASLFVDIIFVLFVIIGVLVAGNK